jgi:hypothetical protein
MYRFKKLAFLTLALFALSAGAAPGTPIGGIIVKGGKNPGGQMLVLGTTDANGKFDLKLAEAGDYKLAFHAPDKAAPAPREARNFQLDYMIQASVQPGAGRDTRPASPPTKVSTTLKNAELLLTVPKGGAELRGVLYEPRASADVNPMADRAINENGVSVQSTKPKGGAK